MNIPYVMKKCGKCGRWLVASTVNFHRSKKGRYRLASQCKECRNKDHKQYRENNKEKMAEYYKQYREVNREKIAEQHKRYCENNKEKIAEYHKQWYQDNKEKEFERVKQWQEANRDKVAEKSKRYRQTPQGQVAAFNCQQRRRAKEEQQGDGITKDQWLDMMYFFDWKCAYSGKYIGGNSFNRTLDHIVPLNSGGDHEIWNLVPMTKSLNSSKQDKEMLSWYKQQDCFDEDRLAKIYEWQEYARKKWQK